jgi:hypothetical protein
MPTRRPAFILACLLFVSGFNVCRGDKDGKSNDAGTTTPQTSKSETKRATSAARAKQSFKKIVSQNFPSWDQNRDGRLSADEIDRLIADPSIHGLEAAAIAAIHRYVRSDGAPQSVTLEDLLTEAEQQAVVPESAGQEAFRTDLSDEKPRYVSHYTRFASHLKKAPRDLFTDASGPTLEGIKQGSIGDCFFMCVIGATVSRDARSVRKMLRANPDGTTDVKFPGARLVRVPPLTDGEIALTSSAADQGIWVNVLEKAFGELRYAKPTTHHTPDDIDLDVISRGGIIGSTIQLMTGHKPFFIAIRQNDKNKKRQPPTKAEIPHVMARLDSAFSKAFAANRLVCCDIAPGIKGKDIPPGLCGHHAYAILGYDRTSRTVTVWNPHGKDYTPKASPPNPQNGYPVKGGVFEVPLNEFVRIFNSVTYETSAPRSQRGSSRAGVAHSRP